MLSTDFTRRQLQHQENLHANSLTVHNRNGIWLEGRRPHVLPLGLSTPGEMLLTASIRYNRYLAVTARVVRRSLKEGPRLQAERRGEMELKFAKWEVSLVLDGVIWRG